MYICTYQILTNDDQMLILCLSYLITTPNLIISRALGYARAGWVIGPPIFGRTKQIENNCLLDFLSLLFAHSRRSVYQVQKIQTIFIRGRSQTTFTRRGRQVVLKYPLFVNFHTIQNVNIWGQGVEKSQNLVRVVGERPLTASDEKKSLRNGISKSYGNSMPGLM